MINITVKTLDSQNHIFSVPDDLSVRNFKERIASSVGIPPDKQRLIYCGRVLQDDKKLNEYDADGKVIHLVQRPPPNSSGRAASTSSFSNPDTATHNQHQAQSQRPGFVHRLGGHDGNSFVLGAFTIPSEAMDSNNVQQIVQQVVSGMGELGRNATVMSRTSDDGSTVDVHINLGQVPLQGDAQNRISLILNMIRRANNCINRLENPNSTTPVNEEAQNEENSRSEQSSAASDLHGTMEFTDAAPRQSTDENVTEMQEPGTRLRPTIISSGFASIADAAQMAATAAFAAATSAARATGLATNYSNSSRLSSQQTHNEQQHQGGNDSMNSNFRSSAPNQPTPQVTHPPALVNAIMELQALHSRFQPLLNQYLDCLREDRNFQDNNEEQTRAQTLFNCVSSVMHYISHAYHAASDVMIDMSQSPPRNLRCRPVIVQQPAMIQAGLPVQAHINVSTTLNATRSASQAANSNSSANTSTNNSSQTSSNLPSSVSSDSSNTVPSVATSEQALPNTPIIGAIPSSVASLFSSSNPFVVMELGPSSITIDSISAVTSEGSGSQPVHISGSRFPEVVVQQAPSQDLIQNLMQAVGQTATQRFGVNGQSQARGNTATHPTTSTQTRSTSRPIQTIPLAIPGFPIATFDPYLPCSSRHVAGLHRPLLPVRAMQQQQSQQQQQQQPSAGGSTVPLDAQLAGMVANVMSAFFSNSGSGNSGAVFSGPPRTSNVRSQVASGFPRILVDLMSQWRQAAGEASQYSTIADFLRSLPDFSYREGEGLLSDLMMCIARHMSLREFIEVLFGRTEILSRLRSHLQQFVRTNVLRGKDPTDSNIHAAVTEMTNSIIDELRIVKGDIEIKDGIDYFATMRNFCEQRLLSLINLILSSDGDAEFGSALYTICRQIVSEHISLDIYCFKNGQQAVEQMVQNRVRRVASDMDHFTQHWMISWCSSQVRGMIPNIITQENDIVRYVVHSRETHSATGQGTSQMFETQECSPPQSEEAQTSPMDVDVVNTSSTESFHVTAVASGNGNTANSAISESNVSNTLPSEPAWTNAVPPDWVPMITEDIERQRRQSTQRPFSDAYLGMMSSKRRKVMSNGRLHAVVDTANILPDTIRRAVATAGVQPTTSVNELTQDVAASATLNSVFEKHLCKAICKRLNEDKDYRPEKFPNAENVFNSNRHSGENV